jgi:hypothetical protein
MTGDYTSGVSLEFAALEVEAALAASSTIGT